MHTFFKKKKNKKQNLLISIYNKNSINRFRNKIKFNEYNNPMSDINYILNTKSFLAEFEML